MLVCQSLSHVMAPFKEGASSKKLNEDKLSVRGLRATSGMLVIMQALLLTDNECFGEYPYTEQSDRSLYLL